MIRTLHPNDELCRPGSQKAIWQVVDPRPRGEHIKLFNLEATKDEYKKFTEVNDAIVKGELVVRRLGAPFVSAAAQNDPKLDERLEHARSVLREVEEAQQEHGVSFLAARDIVADKWAKDGKEGFPSRSALYRYWKAVRNGLPPFHGDGCKGNRTPRYGEDVVQLICETANNLYLQVGSQWTLRDITQKINRDARERKLIEGTARISRRFVFKTIVSNLSADPDVERMDPKLVAAAKSVARNRITATLPFERVEQDAVHLPFVVETPHGPVSNVWLVHAIDCATGLPVGWAFKIGSPAASDGLRCVESIVFPKTELFDGLNIKCDLDVYGTPQLLIFDNGPEARAERMHRLVKLNMDVMHCRSHAAHGKPFIERLNKALKEALQTLPGCTRMDDKDGSRDPIALGDKLMSFDELKQWVVRWYYEDWANRTLTRHLRSDFRGFEQFGGCPAKRWQAMTGRFAYAIPLSPARAEWRMALYEHETRTLSRKTGITYRTFNYRGQALQYLIDKYGERTVKVYANPDDYRQVFVDDGDEAPLVALTEEYVDDSSPAYSFKEAEAALKGTQPSPEQDAIRNNFQADVHDKSANAPKAPASKTSKAQRNRDVVEKVKADDAAKRAATTPLQKSTPVPSEQGSTADLECDESAFDDVTAVPVRSRTGGEAQT